MEIKIDLEKLRNRKLFVATPMYGGNASGIYTRSMCDLTALCVKYGIEVRSYFLFNESLITRARNYCVDEFLRSDAHHLMFIDADIGFDPKDIIALMALQDDDSSYDVIAGPYPKKCITWEKILQAVNKGVADSPNNPNALEDFVGDFVFNPAMDEGESSKTIRLDEPAEVLETGTGFMMIRRPTLEKYKEHYPQYSYKPDHVRTAEFDGSREIHAYFDCIIDPKTRRYLSEDYMFCQNVRQMGMKVWLCPWMHLQHAGTYVFAGKLPALASIGASATADADLLNKFKPGSLPKSPTPQIAAPSVPKAVPVSSIAASPELLKKFKPI
jgi:glycosyltransferase involved in cell wall biosynthesis